MSLAVVRLSGGFGNQLFQYLFGLAYGALHHVDVVFDATDSVSPTAARPLKLTQFGLKGVFLQAERTRHPDGAMELRGIQVLQGRFGAPELRLPIIEELSFDYAPPPPPTAGVYLDGYWQSWKYWEGADAIHEPVNQALAKFKLPRPLKQLRARLGAGPSTAVHLRRGDYLRPFYREIHGLCLPAFYQAGVAAIESEKGVRPISIFTDDVAAAAELFPERDDVSIVSSQTSSDLEDFVLMTACDALVISNSSFSYLAAWFSQREGRRVVAPYPWFSNRMETADLLPPDWLVRNRASGATAEQDRARVKNATVSVIIPTMNRDHLLPATIETALAQTLKPTEIILSLNAASPAVRAVAKRYAAAHPTVRFVEDSVASLPRARNTGLNLASGEWVAFLDDDDLWDADKLERQVEASVRFNADVVACDFDQFDDKGRYDISHLSRLHYHTTWLEALTTGNVVGGGSVVLARRSAIEACGRFDEALRACEDHDMWRRLILNGFSLSFLPQKMAHYRIARDNMTRNNRLMLSGEFAHLGKIVWESQDVDNAFVQKAFERLLTPSFQYFGQERAVAPDSAYSSPAPWMATLVEKFHGQVSALMTGYESALSDQAALVDRVHQLAETTERLQHALTVEQDRALDRESELLDLQVRALFREQNALERVGAAVQREAVVIARDVELTRREGARSHIRPIIRIGAFPAPQDGAWRVDQLNGEARLLQREAAVIAQEGKLLNRQREVLDMGKQTVKRERHLAETAASAARAFVAPTSPVGEGADHAGLMSASSAESGALDRAYPFARWRALDLDWRACDGSGQRFKGPSVSLPVPTSAWVYGAISDPIVRPDMYEDALVEVVVGEIRGLANIVFSDAAGATFHSPEARLTASRHVFLYVPPGVPTVHLLVRNGGRDVPEGEAQIEAVRLLTRSDLHALADPSRRVPSWHVVDAAWRATSAPDSALGLPAAFHVPDAAWAFAALSDPIILPDGEAVFEVTIFASQGRCGLGVVSEDGTNLISPEAVVETGELKTVHLACPEGLGPVRLMVRNHDTPGVVGFAEIFKVRIGQVAPRPAAGNEPSRAGTSSAAIST